MRLFYSTTSPYARIARIALAEKGLRAEPDLTDPWQDAPGLVAANPSARVPTLLLDSGLPLTESLLIVLWLETQHAQPSLLGTQPQRALSQAGMAMGAIDAAASIIIGRRVAPTFDDTLVGLRRRRSITAGLRRLEAHPPTLGPGSADLGVITAVVLADYIAFRFPAAEWVPATPRLKALAEHANSRTNFGDTLPREMPKP